jgi:hypothetical protein
MSAGPGQQDEPPTLQLYVHFPQSEGISLLNDRRNTTE